MTSRFPISVQAIINDYLPFDKLCGWLQGNGQLIPSKVYPLLKMYGSLVKQRLLSEYGFDEKFSSILQKDNAVVSGSFILQVLIDEYWESDLDIYILKDLDSPGERLKKYLFEKTNSNVKTLVNKYSNLIGVISVDEYIIKGKKVQVINLDRQSVRNIIFKSYNVDRIVDRIAWNKQPDKNLIREWIKLTFDFEFCTSTYDGTKSVEVPCVQSLGTRSSDHRGYLKGDDLKPLDFKYGADFHHRSLKYIDRGFTITNYSRPSIIEIPVERIFGQFKAIPVKCEHLIPELARRKDLKIQWVGGRYSNYSDFDHPPK